MEYIIYASLVLITLMCLWALISIPKNYLFKSLLIPVMILVAVSTWYTYNAILGYGTEFRPDKEVVYHSHVADKKGGKIYILLTTFGDDAPRLHIYPWSEELEKQLQGAGDKQKEGVLVVGKFEKNKPSISSPMLDEEQYQFFMMPPNEWMPKN
jgi:hypothetical protein